jgi:uncharacterized iron-regulated protein
VSRGVVALLLALAACASPHYKYDDARDMLYGNACFSAPSYSLRLAPSGKEVGTATLLTRLEGDVPIVVCAGESHPNVYHHWLQLQLLKLIHQHSEKPVYLGLEMVPWPLQDAVTDAEAQCKWQDGPPAAIAWDWQWGYSWELYKPVIQYALGAMAAKMLAIGPPAEVRNAIRRVKAVNVLPARWLASAPARLADDDETAVMDLSGYSGEEAQAAFAEFSLATETMAECIASTLYPGSVPQARACPLATPASCESPACNAATPPPVLVALTGSLHCAPGSLPRALHRLLGDRPVRIVSVVPVLYGQSGSSIADMLIGPWGEKSVGEDSVFLGVMSMPQLHSQKECRVVASDRCLEAP